MLYTFMECIDFSEETIKTLEETIQCLDKNCNALNNSLIVFSKTLNAKLLAETGWYSRDLEGKKKAIENYGEHIVKNIQGLSKKTLERVHKIKQFSKDVKSDSVALTSIMNSALHRSVRSHRLPRKNGHWVNRCKPGDCMWVPNNHEIIAVLKEFGVDGVIYRHGFPDFSPFIDKSIGGVKLDSVRGSYAKVHNDADKAVTQVKGSIFYEKTPEEVHAYMVEHDLVWHECEDRRTVIPIPRIINNSFPHTGGMGLERQLFQLGLRLQQKLKNGSWVCIRRLRTI